MFVKTQFETIVNLTEFEKIKIEWSETQPSGNIFHTISAMSEEYSYRPMMGAESIEISSEVPMRTYKSETLAQFPKDMTEEAKKAFNDLFKKLRSGASAFDISRYAFGDSTGETE